MLVQPTRGRLVGPSPPLAPSDLLSLIGDYSDGSSFRHLCASTFPEREARKLVLNAYAFGRELFEGMERDSGGLVFYGHLVPTAVLAIKYWEIYDANIIAALLLHDAQEDIEWVTNEIIAYKTNPEVAYLVEGVTHPPLNGCDKKTPEYVRQTFAKVEEHGLGCMIMKGLCDRLQNMLTLTGSTERKLAKIRETEIHVLPMLKRYSLPTRELEMAIEWKMSEILLESQ